MGDVDINERSGDRAALRSEFSDNNQNHKNKEPRGFKEGDRVRVNDSWDNVDRYLQKDNRVGTVVGDVDSEECYWLQMDKPVTEKFYEWSDTERPSDIPDGYAYFARLDELEPADSAKEKHQKKVVKKTKKEAAADKAELKALKVKLKNLIQTALNLTQAIKKTFKETKQYPIFGINLEKREPEEKTQKPDLSESLYSLGVILYHLYTGQSEHDNISYLLDGYPKPEDMPEELWRALNKLLKKEYENVNEFRKDLKKCKDGG